MRIQLLGPVGVEAAGRALDVGPRQRRAVLAALAVDAGAPVSIDTLADRVWGADPPEAPRSALYAHVTRLRRALGQAGPTGEQRLGVARAGDGYVLNVDRELVDLHRFQVLAEAGRSAPGADGDRVGGLREAMDLWRGTPLSTLAGDWAARVRRSVESQFVSVAVAWGFEELRLGNAAAVADRLAGIVEAFPLAEPLVVLQMRALCAVGRSSEALQCYAETRAKLVEQLGVEPGAELRGLHVAVLRGELDEPMSGREPAAAAPVTQVPRQLPADLSRFVGRAHELARIVDWLAPGHPGATPVVAIYGAAGVGKSALAIHAAQRLAGRYPDGQVYLDLRGSSAGVSPLSPADAVARLLRTLGVVAPYTPMEVDEAAALFRSLVAGRRLLLLLDNAVDAAQVGPLLPSGTGCGTLVTSRRLLADLGDTRQVWIGALSGTEAVTLLSQWVGTDRVAAEPDAAAAIAQWCERLPLALRVAGARLVARPGWPLAELCDRLADERRRLDNLELDGVGVRASMAGSYQPMSHSADLTERATAEAFMLLGASDESELDRSAAARLLARSEVDAERVLERLVDAQLLETSSPGSYRMGDLLRLYARERLAGRREV